MPKCSGDASSNIVCENALFSRVETLKCTHVWKVKKFSRCLHRSGEMIISPTFYSGSNHEFQWNIVMYPNGKSEEFEGFVSIFLSLLPGNIEDMKISLSFSVLDNSLEKVKTLSGTRQFGLDEDICPWKKASCGWETFISRDYLFNNKHKLLPMDVLSVLCETCIECSPLDYKQQELETYHVFPQLQSCVNAGIFLDNEKFSDVILRVDNRDFKAHRAMLAANSPVFALMLESDIQKNQSTIELVNLKPEIMCELLHYMYTGQIKSMDVKTMENLLAASEKYMLGGLKAICEQKLVMELNVLSAPCILDLADKYRAMHLKKHCLDFIRLHLTEVVNCKSWKTIVEQRPHLIVEAFNILALDSKKRDHVNATTSTSYTRE